MERLRRGELGGESGLGNGGDDGKQAKAGAETGGEGGGELKVGEVVVPAIERDGDGADGTAEIGQFEARAGGPDGGRCVAQECGTVGTVERAGEAKTVGPGGDDEVDGVVAGVGGDSFGGMAVKSDTMALGVVIGFREEGVEFGGSGSARVCDVGDGETEWKAVGELGDGADGAEAGVREVGGEEQIEFRHCVSLSG